MKSISQIYNLVIESLLLEGLSFDELYEKYYKNDVEDLETFKKIVEVDPTSTASKKGKYVDWLIRQAYKADKQHFFEDAYKTTEDLKTFDKNFSKIKKQISQIKNSHELYDIVKDFQEKLDKGEIDLSRSEIKAGAEKIYDDGQWLIVHPKTKEAAMYYGKNTRWCTAGEKENAFDRYNKIGPLYILINRKNPAEKYQFHFQKNQYMDSEDKEINEQSYNSFPILAIDKLISLAPDDYMAGRFISITSKNIQSKYKKQLDEYNLSKYIAYNIEKISVSELNNYIKDGIDIHYNIREMLNNICEYGLLELLKFLKEKLKINIRFNNDELLITAVYNKQLNIIKYLVKNGANIHVKKELPLQIAIQVNSLELVKYFVNNGADIHINNERALSAAVIHKKLPIVKYLVDIGADIFIENNIMLRNALIGGDLNIINYLISKGADINMLINDKKLMKYVDNNIKEYVKSLGEI